MIAQCSRLKSSCTIWQKFTDYYRTRIFAKVFALFLDISLRRPELGSPVRLLSLAPLVTIA